jgi:membrane-associated phospholipid phosphatase
MSRTALARAVSIAGHPVVVLPAAILADVWGAAPPSVVRQAVLPAVLVGAGVMAYSAVQVRRGRWRHIDASVRKERAQLNLFLAGLLVLVATVLWATDRPWGVVAGVGSTALVVVVAHATRRWLKISLHVALATFAAAFLWPRLGGVFILLACAAAVAWSRLVLERHTRAEVVAGALLGLAVGGLFLTLRG